jgi:hypothetical protein
MSAHFRRFIFAFVAIVSLLGLGCTSPVRYADTRSSSAKNSDEETVSPSPAPTPFPTSTPTLSGQLPMLTPNDFSYLGHYVVPINLSNSMAWGQGFTHRYVNGQLRFMALTFKGNIINQYSQNGLVEFASPSNIGGTVTNVTGYWNDIWNAGGPIDMGSHLGIWWDEGGQRLWLRQLITHQQI